MCAVLRGLEHHAVRGAAIAAIRESWPTGKIGDGKIFAVEPSCACASASATRMRCESERITISALALRGKWLARQRETKGACDSDKLWCLTQFLMTSGPISYAPHGLEAALCP